VAHAAGQGKHGSLRPIELLKALEADGQIEARTLNGRHHSGVGCALTASPCQSVEARSPVRWAGLFLSRRASIAALLQRRIASFAKLVTQPDSDDLVCKVRSHRAACANVNWKLPARAR
jgi:hypothetical protein